MPRVAESWLRNWIACMAMYYTVGALWAYYIYWCFGNVFFGPGKMPGIEDVWSQIQVYFPMCTYLSFFFFFCTMMLQRAYGAFLLTRHGLTDAEVCSAKALACDATCRDRCLM